MSHSNQRKSSTFISFMQYSLNFVKKIKCNSVYLLQINLVILVSVTNLQEIIITICAYMFTNSNEITFSVPEEKKRTLNKTMFANIMFKQFRPKRSAQF